MANSPFTVDKDIQTELTTLFGADYARTLITQAEALGKTMQLNGIQSKANLPFKPDEDEEDDEDDKALKVASALLVMNQKSMNEVSALTTHVKSLEVQVQDAISASTKVLATLDKLLGKQTRASKNRQTEIGSEDQEANFLERMNGDPDAAEESMRMGTPIFNQVTQRGWGQGPAQAQGVSNFVTPPSVPGDGS